MNCNAFIDNDGADVIDPHSYPLCGLCFLRVSARTKKS